MLFRQRLGDAQVKLPNSVTWQGLDEHLGNLIVREYEPTLSAFIRGTQQSGESGFGDRQAHRRLAPGAGTHEHPNVELPAGDRRRRQHGLRAR
jgi:hypothetical protein